MIQRMSLVQYGLVKVKWSDVQTGLSNEVWTAFVALTNQYTLDLSNYLAAVEAGSTNAVEPGAPVYVPRVPEAAPGWLRKRNP